MATPWENRPQERIRPERAHSPARSIRKRRFLMGRPLWASCFRTDQTHGVALGCEWPTGAETLRLSLRVRIRRASAIMRVTDTQGNRVRDRVFKSAFHQLRPLLLLRFLDPSPRRVGRFIRPSQRQRDEGVDHRLKPTVPCKPRAPCPTMTASWAVLNLVDDPVTSRSHSAVCLARQFHASALPWAVQTTVLHPGNPTCFQAEGR